MIDNFDEERFNNNTKRIFDGILKLANDVNEHSKTLPEKERQEFIQKFIER